MFQYYVIELQQYHDGSYGHLVHPVWDAEDRQARLKGESKYFEVLAAAALSGLPRHGAILITSAGEPIYNRCYTNNN